EVRLSLPGTMESVARKAPRHARTRYFALALHHVPRKPRSDLQLALWAAGWPALASRPLPCTDGAAAPGSRNANVVPGSGIWRQAALFVLRRSPRGAGGIGAQGPPAVSVPVSLARHARIAGGSSRSGR